MIPDDALPFLNYIFWSYLKIACEREVFIIRAYDIKLQ